MHFHQAEDSALPHISVFFLYYVRERVGKGKEVAYDFLEALILELILHFLVFFPLLLIDSFDPVDDDTEECL